MSNPAQVNAPELRNPPHETDPNLKNKPPQIYNYAQARAARRESESELVDYTRRANLGRERTIADFTKDADV